MRCPCKRKIKKETLNETGLARVLPETDSDTRIWCTWFIWESQRELQKSRKVTHGEEGSQYNACILNQLQQWVTRAQPRRESKKLQNRRLRAVLPNRWGSWVFTQQPPSVISNLVTVAPRGGGAISSVNSPALPAYWASRQASVLANSVLPCLVGPGSWKSSGTHWSRGVRRVGRAPTQSALPLALTSLTSTRTAF